jgi:hypothetical protein
MSYGVVLDGSAVGRFHWLALGLNADTGGFITSVSSVGGLAGLALRADSGLRFDLLGAAGVHSYRGWGASLLGDDPGAAARLPYAGAKARLAYVIGHSSAHVTAGIDFGLDTDLERAHRQYQYESTGWLFGGTSVQTASHTVGGTCLSGSVFLGGVLDLGG